MKYSFGSLDEPWWGVSHAGANVEVHPGGAAVPVIGGYRRGPCTRVALFLGSRSGGGSQVNGTCPRIGRPGQCRILVRASVGGNTCKCGLGQTGISLRWGVRYAIRKFASVSPHRLVGIDTEKAGDRVRVVPAGITLHARAGAEVAREAPSSGHWPIWA